MPVLGMAQDSGVVVQWLVADGQAVKEGDPLLEVETDKAVVEVPAMASGVLAHVTAGEGDEVPTGTVIAMLLDEDEAEGYAVGGAGSATPVTETAPSARPPPAASSPTAPEVAAPAPSRSATRSGPSQPSTWGSLPPQIVVPSGPDRQRPLASPKAKRLARELGLDLKSLPGSGPNGAVRALDIAALLSGSRASAAQSAAAAVGSPRAATWLRTDVPLAPLRELVDKANVYLARNGPLLKVEASDVLVQLTLAGLAAMGARRPESLGLTRYTDAGETETLALSGGGLHSLMAIARAREEGTTAGAATGNTRGDLHLLNLRSLDLHLLDLSAAAFESALPPLPAGCRLRVTLANASGGAGVSGALTVEYLPDPPVDPVRLLARLRQLFEDPLGALLYL